MKILVTVFTIFFSIVTSAAVPLNKLVVFGDSLSDNGNLYEYMKHQLPVSPPYYKGRFTNGPVWVELLMDGYYAETGQAHLEDYAFGGAGVLAEVEDDEGLFTLRQEMDSYFLAHQDKADEQSLYMIWIGSNNYLGVPDDAEKSLNIVNNGIQSALQRLVDKGAKYILVLDVPDLGLTPAARDFDAVDKLTYLSLQHNLRVEKVVMKFKQRYPDVQWLFLDVNETFTDIIHHPEKYGFANVIGTCYEEAGRPQGAKSILKMVASVKQKSLGTAGACDGFFFFDPVHPSAAVHQLVAERTRMLLDLNGVVFG